LKTHIKWIDCNSLLKEQVFKSHQKGQGLGLESLAANLEPGIELALVL